MVIAVINHKGGAGKTTTTINVGCALAKKGKRVLVIDFDAQGSLTYSMGIESDQLTVGHALLGQAELLEVIKEREGVSIIPGGASLVEAEIEMARADEHYDFLTALLANYLDFDYTLIDCAPSLSILSVNALKAASHVLIPMQMDVLALKGLDSLLLSLEELEQQDAAPQVLGVLPVMVTGRRNLEREVEDHIKDNYDVRVFKQAIRMSVKAAEAPSFGMSVLKYAPSSTCAQDYTEFANELLKINKSLTITT